MSEWSEWASLPEYEKSPSIEPLRCVPDAAMDYYPILSPGIPPPGVDFIAGAEAKNANGVKFKVKKIDGVSAVTSCPPEIDEDYRKALYRTDFAIKLKFKGREETVKTIPGHIWGGTLAGPQRARAILLGKWPGQDEVRYSRNMCGPSGAQMAEAFAATGMAREVYDSFYVTNLIKHPNVDLSSQRVPAAWTKNMRPLLEQEIRLVRPEYILCLGAEATEALLPDEGGVAALAGRAVDKRFLVSKPGQPEEWHSVRIMTCVHPAFVLRAQDKLPDLLRGVQTFVDAFNSGTAPIAEPTYDSRVIYQERELAAIVDQILANNGAKESWPVAIDCEWEGDYVNEPGSWLRTIQFAINDTSGFCVALRHAGGQPAFSPSIASAVPHLRRLFLANGARIVGHNFRADLPWIRDGLDEQLGKDMMEAFQAPLDEGGIKGYERTKWLGGFDTMLAAHAVRETEPSYSLDILASAYCKMPRYDRVLEQWKKGFCADRDIKPKDLEGYGFCPDEILHPYAIKDVIATIMLFHHYNGRALDCDTYGLNSRRSFWHSMRATLGVEEMTRFGVLVDRSRNEKLTKLYVTAKNRLLESLRGLLNWPTFNPNSPEQCLVAIFGSQYLRKVDKEGKQKQILPAGAKSLGLTPIKTSGKPSKDWSQIVARKQTHLYSPCTDKEVLGGLITRLKGEEKTGSPNKPGYEEVLTLRDLRFTGQILKSVLRPPRRNAAGEVETDAEGNQEFDAGIVAAAGHDGKVRGHISQTKETGRFSMARPNLQAISKRREAAYARILGADYTYPIRTILLSSPGYVFVEADYIGAELFMMATQSDDAVMLDHVLRSNLPDDHLNKYDIHSTIAVNAFHLDCLANKAGLQTIKKAYLRDVSKTVVFGLAYGRGDAAVVRAVEEEGVQISLEDAGAIRDAVLNQYPRLGIYLDECQQRVTTPGWLSNCFGRYRRFTKSQHATDNNSMEREASNAPIQGGVADAINQSIDHLYNYPGRILPTGEYRYRMVLQMHDALLFEVRYQDLDWFLGNEKEHRDGVLQECMTHRVLIDSCDLDGRPKPDTKPLTMGVEYAVMFNWGEKPDRERGLACGIPGRFLPKPQKVVV